MTRHVFVAVLVATFSTTASLESAQKLDDKETAFLQKAAQGQLAEIVLGTLALKKASHKDVKEFGAEISEDHQYASQEPPWDLWVATLSSMVWPVQARN